MAIPPGVAAVQNVGLSKVSRDIAVGMSRAVIAEHDRAVIKVQRLFALERFAWNGAGRRCRKGVIPRFDTRGGR
jgi:hypothetical protein